MRSVLLETTSRLVFPLMMVFAVFMFLRGHNMPGGGFIGGLLASAAMILVYVTFGMEADDGWFDYRLVAAAGLLCAALAGLWPMFAGMPFMTSMFGQVHVPLFGPVDVSTVLLFDFGVFLVVVGSIVGAVKVLVLEPRQQARDGEVGE